MYVQLLVYIYVLKVLKEKKNNLKHMYKHLYMCSNFKLDTYVQWLKKLSQCLLIM